MQTKLSPGTVGVGIADSSSEMTIGHIVAVQKNDRQQKVQLTFFVNFSQQ